MDQKTNDLFWLDPNLGIDAYPVCKGKIRICPFISQIEVVPMQYCMPKKS